MDMAREKAAKSEDDVDEEIRAATTDQEHANRRDWQISLGCAV